MVVQHGSFNVTNVQITRGLGRESGADFAVLGSERFENVAHL